MSQYDTPRTPGNGYDPLPDTHTDTDPIATPYLGSSTSYDSEPSSTPAVAADQAKQVGHEALDGGRQVAQVAVDEASSVVGEAGTQAKNLLGEARTQLTDQAATQQNNLATWISSIVDELDGMVDRSEGGNAQSGPATSLVRQVSSRGRSAAGWLESHEPADLLSETSRFARQRPGMFLALAAAAGLVTGRLTRGLTADASASKSSTSPSAVDARSTSMSPRPVVTTTTSDPMAVQPFHADEVDEIDEISTAPAARTGSEPAWDVR
ncbi:MAG TPA: hypothetical protein VIG79_06330 [Lapillicoccus sp.]|uniref:hypothetical protein n=1 Tax=Lapillicoccus sp. TaxID=1909287 RepID=UPI002F925595